MVLEAHCANYREKSRLEKAEIINATFTKNGDIIHTRHLENPQRRALPGKHTQEGQTEGQRSRKRSGKRREKRDRSKAKETESCSCRNLSLNILQSPHSGLPLLSLQLKPLIVVCSTLSPNLPLWKFISRSNSSLNHFWTYIRLPGHGLFFEWK